MRYTDAQKRLMIKVAIEAIKKLEESEEFNGVCPKSFKNYVWATQAMMDGGAPVNAADELVLKVIREK